MITRRNFLEGVCVGAVGTAALIQLPTIAQVAAIQHQPIDLLTKTVHKDLPRPGVMVYVQLNTGEYEPIGFITEIVHTTSLQDVTGFNGEIAYAPGLRRSTIKFEGLG